VLFRNGVDSKRFNGNENIDKNNKIRLIYAGLLGVAQGISGICRNVDFKCLGAEFHIYGAGLEKEAIEKILRENPDSNIFLHSVVKKREIPSLLKSFDGAVIPLKKSIYGAVPSKIYEAMAAGLPILFSGEGEGSRIIKERQVGWVSPAGDFQKLEDNIKEFVHNNEKRTLYANNGIDSACQIFDRKIQIQGLHEFLQTHLK
jgi:glycosyltransferase involved in cell wall biosynthesis